MADSSDDTVAQASSDSESGSESDSDQPGTNQVSPFASEIIEILVGSAEKRYYAHKGVICNASPFFQRCLNTEMKEGSTKTVKLPDDEPRAFEWVLPWAYSKEIRKPEKSWGVRMARRLYQTYLLADKLCMEALCNAIMDVVIDWHQTDYSFANLVPELTPSPLKDFVKAQVAWDLRDPEVWNKKGTSAYLKEFFLSGTPEVVEVMRANGKLIQDEQEGETIVDPCKEPKCKYHKHMDTQKCKEGEVASS